jgi:DNA-directed RNA polymerase subunit beta
MPKDPIQFTLNQLMSMTGDARNNVIINSTVKDTVGTILNSVEDDNVKLKVNNIKVVEKYDNTNVAQQKDVRNKGQVWSNDLRADLQLIDKKTGNVIDNVENMKIADIPKLTDRGSFLIGGIEYQFVKQARLKPGVYTQRQKNGEISSFFNVDKTIDFERGFNNNFRLGFDPEKKVFMMTYGTKNIPLINALRTIGVTNNEMATTWGKDVFDANANAYDKHQAINQNKLFEAVFGKQPSKEMNDIDVSKQIKERLFATQLDPEVTEITLGKPYKEVNKSAILDASKKIIDINRGAVEQDDRESLIFKSFYDIEDHMREKLVKGSEKIIGNIRYKLNKNKSIKRSLSPQTFNPLVTGTITNSSLSSPPSQVNPIAMLGEGSKFTVMGDGGVGSANAITNEARQISNSELSFVDPLHTPEGGNIGVATHMTMNTIKVGNDLYSRFLNQDGKKVFLRPIDVYNKSVAFPDQFTVKSGKPHAVNDMVKVIKAGKLIEVNKIDVVYVIPSAIEMFDSSVNSIPFLDSIQGNRGLTAAKMQEQALSLKHRDKPLFKIVDEEGNGLASILASNIALTKSPVDGHVKSVSDDKIVIEEKGGKTHDIHLYNNFSLNSESYLHNESRVKRGDTVNVGDVIADNNFTKDGQISLGANLRVAYMPYRGYNYEDSAIMSESAAKKLTSQHMYDLKAKRSSKGVFSANK